ncbi:MAG: cupredoxin domain-containing protein [Nanoarchaeota archaeon]|nr:cupredoxin domain-containing protein [Nanoarchaeota archaeon]
MEKKGNVFIIAILVLAVLVGGFFLFNNPSDSSSNNGEGIVVVEKSGSQDTNTQKEEPSSPETEKVPEIKEFNIIAKRWDFSPSTITVNEGDTVILNIESIDVTHGFAISEFGVSEQLVSGNTVKVEFIADKKGTFSFFCNVFCGSGHSSMRGTLVVQ